MKKAIIYIYDYIGGDSVNSNYIRQIVSQYEDQGIEDFELHISSMGGSVFEGIAIYNFLKTKKVDVYVDGVAASIASVVAMAGRKVYMHSSSMMMIHNPWVMEAGESEDLRKTAEALDQIKSAIVQAYMEKTKLPKAEIEDMMNQTTWLTAQEARKKGFCDEVVKIKQTQKNYVACYVDVIDDEISPTNKDNTMNKKLLKFLGLPENATDQQIEARLTELKGKLKLSDDATIDQIVDKILEAAPSGSSTTGQDPEKPVIIPITQNQGNEFKDPRVDKLLQETLKDKAEALVQGAIDDFKINAIDKPLWLNQAISNFDETKALLDKRPKNFVKPQSLQVDKSLNNNSGEEKDNPVTKAADFFKAQGRQPQAVKK